MNGDRVLRIVAALVLWIAPLPAAFFVGRSVYWHLVYGWHLDLGFLGIAAAVVSGAMIELVGILSAHVALACHRWNGHGNVKKKERPWERAPFWLAAFCFLVYALVAIALAVVLEAWPHLAVYAPALVTAMAADAYIALGIYEQHRDRLARYNLAWNWKPKQEELPALQPEPVAQVPAVPAMPAELPALQDRILIVHQQQPGWTQVRIAQELGCHPGTVSKALGKNGHGRPERLPALNDSTARGD